MKAKRWTVLILAFVIFGVFFWISTKYNKSKTDFEGGFDKLASYLLVYNINFTKNTDWNFVLLEKNFARIVPSILFELSDVLIGYGISRDIEFEDNFSLAYKKSAFGFDCGVTNVKIKSPDCKFYSECISNDKFIKKELGQISSKKIHSFSSKIKELKLEDKKIFLKLSFVLEGELEALKDILKDENQIKNITGLAISLQLDDLDSIQKALEISKLLDKNFILCSRTSGASRKNGDKYFKKIINSKNYKGELGYNLLYLVYANKNLTKNYSISLNQNDNLIYSLKNTIKIESNKNAKLKITENASIKDLNICKGKIKFWFVLKEKIKEIFNKNKKATISDKLC